MDPVTAGLAAAVVAETAGLAALALRGYCRTKSTRSRLERRTEIALRLPLGSVITESSPDGERTVIRIGPEGCR